MGDMSKAAERRKAPLQTPSVYDTNAIRDLSAALTALLADTFAIYLKTKNFHWHMSGPHFRDYHLMLDEQGDQIFAMTDPLAERVRKIGGTTLRSIGQISRLQRVEDNDADYVTPQDMLAELREDNKDLIGRLREAHDLCDEHDDVATAPSSRTGSTRPSGACGSCSKPPATGTSRPKHGRRPDLVKRRQQCRRSFPRAPSAP